MLTDAQRAVLTEEESKLYDNADHQGLVKSWIGRVVRPALLSLADTRIQLAEARRDAERMVWAMNNAHQSGAFNRCCFPNIVRLEYVDENTTPVLSDWCLYTEQPRCTPVEQYRIRLGSGPVPALTPEARTIIDAARAAEEAR